MNRFKRYVLAVTLVILLVGTMSEAAAAGAGVKNILKSLLEESGGLWQYVVGNTTKKVITEALKKIEKCYRATRHDVNRRHFCRSLVDGEFGSDEKLKRFIDDLYSKKYGPALKYEGILGKRESFEAFHPSGFSDIETMLLCRSLIWRFLDDASADKSSDGAPSVPGTRQPRPPL